MKSNIPVKIHKRMTKHDKFYGLTTMGVRGQVVVPAEARKDLRLKPGDQLVVIGKFGKALGFIKAQELEDLAKIIMKNFESTGMEHQVKDYIGRVFKKQFSKS